MVSVNREETGDNIRRLMRKNKVSTYDLMVYMHLTSPTSIYAWTQGRIIPSADNLVKLADIFKCTVDDILIVNRDMEGVYE